jgi:hypothetical protein
MASIAKRKDVPYVQHNEKDVNREEEWRYMKLKTVGTLLKTEIAKLNKSRPKQKRDAEEDNHNPIVEESEVFTKKKKKTNHNK